MRKIFILSFFALLTSCISTKNTIQNIDNTAQLPKIVAGQFVLTEMSTDLKYGFNEFYPVNIGFSVYETSNNLNVNRFFNAITGPNGEKVTYQLLETCCPFPSKNNKMGAGTLDIYEIFLDGKSSNKKIYINTFEKGKIICPKGFSIKKV